MSSIPRSVALVGRPNVGKSRLFNRLAGRRISIVHDQPGVTRDLVTTQVPPERGGYLLMDTGGIGLTPGASSAAIVKATEEQVDFALAAAGLVLFVTDAHAGLTTADERIAENLRSFRKPTILVVNKADDIRRENEATGEFSRLGFKQVVYVSAEHGHGIDPLLNIIFQIIGKTPEAVAPVGAVPERVKFALVGRPNVGKSSLGNALLNDKRLIVSEVPGTTRDAVTIDFDYVTPEGEKWPFTLYDTAGMRHGSRVDTSVEYFSQNRTREAIAESDVVFLVLDALDGVTKQDKMLGGEILEQGKGLVMVVNKWDLAQKRFEREPLEGYANIGEFRKSFLRAVESQMFFLPASPVIFTSALEGTAVTDILKEAHALFTMMRKPLPTSLLNRMIRGFLEASPPKFVGTKRFKCYYAVQVARHPLTIRMYCNRAEKLDDSYARSLASNLQTTFKLRGCPMKFDLIGKPPRSERPLFPKNPPPVKGTKTWVRGAKPWAKGAKPQPGKKRLPRTAEG